MGIINMGIPEKLTIALNKHNKFDLFIETGTYYGVTANWASNHFKKVHTIELSEKIFKETFEKLNHIENIEFHFGDTRNCLTQILTDFKEKSILFWLDAHWSSGNTYGEFDQCPILKELEIINNFNFNSFILIDDARLFLAPPPKPNKIQEYPNITEVLETLNKRKRFTAIYNDVIISVPEYAEDFLKNHLQEVITSEWKNRNIRSKSSIFKNFSKKIFSGWS